MPPPSVISDGGISLRLNGAVVGAGGEAEVFDAGPYVVKRFRDPVRGVVRLEVARELIQRSKLLVTHPASQALVLPVDTIRDAWGAGALVLPRLPTNAVEGMRLVMPKSFPLLRPGQQGNLEQRLLAAARYAAAINAFHLLVDGASLPDCGLRNTMFDLESASAWIIDTDSVVLSGSSGEFTSSVQFDAPELGLGHRPSPLTDLHAMAVTLHLLLVGRHPYSGQRPDPPGGAEAAERRDYTNDPIWSDEPNDPRNRPMPGTVPLAFGTAINSLFHAAFSTTSSPTGRPSGATWAHRLTWLTDRLIPCNSPLCWWKSHPWLLGVNQQRCPVCNTATRHIKPSVIVQFLDRHGNDVLGEAIVVTGAVDLRPRHTQPKPMSLHSPPTGRIRKRTFGSALIAEVDGCRTVTLIPGTVVRIGDRFARIIGM